ncbi:MAG TPA: hypothetical protein VJ927_11350 [Actinomycetota bacterium]|nr:hypothetical protein [Actinomycetota bacterium]
MAFIVGMLAGLTSVAALVIGPVAFMSPYNDLGRTWGWIAAVVLGIASIGLWGLFASLLGRLGDDD